MRVGRRLYLLARNRLSLVRHRNRIFVVKERCGNVDNRCELYNLVDGERVGRFGVYKPASVHRQTVGIQNGEQPFVECALYETQVALVLRILDLQVHLPK